MAVTVVFAGTADGDISSNSATYSNARNGLGTAGVPANSVNELWQGQLFFGTYTCYQAFVDFDLSAINPGQTVSSAVMQTWLITDNTGTDFIANAIGYDWGATVTSADWRNAAALAGQTWWTTISSSGIGATGAYKSWSDTTDIQSLCTAFAGTEINFVLSSDRQVAGVVPTGGEILVWANASVAGTTNDPKLTLVHAGDLLTHVPDTGLYIDGSAVTDWTSPASVGQVDSDLIFEWDLNNDGNFDEPEEDITPYVMAASAMTGRDFPSGLTGETKPGQLKLTLLNNDNRFSYFNTSSPLTADPFSLRTGRKIRVRTSDAVADDPVLLAKDLFQRANGALGTADTGQVWTAETGAWVVRNLVAAANDTLFAPSIVFSTLDVGVTDMYVQGTLRYLTRGDTITRTNGLVIRWTDINNHSRFQYLTDTGLQLIDRAAGVDTTLATYGVHLWEGACIGVGVVNQTITGYLGGAAVCSGTLTGAINGGRAGLCCSYTDNSGRSPEIGDFHVYDHIAPVIDGVVWTGDVSDLQVQVQVGDTKTATVTADGRLVRAAAVKVAAPRLAIAGASPGVIVGDVLQRGGLLHPPHAQMDVGSITTGRFGIADADALSMARLFEDTEQGTLVETNEGPIGFQDANARATAPSQAWFSDTPGVGQYGYHSIVPLDRRSQLINQVVAGVAPEVPDVVSFTAQNSNQHIDVTMPTVADGDLLITLIASSHDGTQDWNNPIWWTNHRDLKGAKGMRVYSHPCNGTESGSVVRFRTWNGAEAGIWRAITVRITDWFKASAGVFVGAFAPGNNPGAVVHGWGRAPTLFIVTACGIGATGSAMAFHTPTDPPDGYGRTASGAIVGGATIPYDIGQTIAYKVDCTETEDPTSYNSLLNTIILESVVVAVRGFNGEHTKQTLDNPNSVGGDGRTVTVDNLISQADYNAVLSHANPSNLFNSASAATDYGESIVGFYGQERQMIELSFWATTNASLRAQAVSRRIGDKVTVTATGSTGLGVEGSFFIEAIGHTWSKAGLKWLCTWRLSPA